MKTQDTYLRHHDEAQGLRWVGILRSGAVGTLCIESAIAPSSMSEFTPNTRKGGWQLV